MKIGLLAYSTNTGLGYQTWDFYKYMNPDKVLVADLSRFNGLETHHERYLGARIDRCESAGYLSKESCEWLVDGMDVVFVAETPLNYYIFEYAKQKGVKTVQQYNFEFFDFYKKPNLAAPTVFAAPTLWRMETVEKMKMAETMLWEVPVDTSKFEPVVRQRVDTFVHIIGRPAIYDRNGTLQFLEAAEIVHASNKKYNYIIYLQRPTDPRALSHFAPIEARIKQTQARLGGKLQIVENVEDNRDMYRAGEVLVLPRKYGGLCLPMWEALASGMPVIMPSISPNHSVLPWNWLARSSFEQAVDLHTHIALYKANPRSLANRMLRIEDSIEQQSRKAIKLAEDMSWFKQKDIYIDRFKKICES